MCSFPSLLPTGERARQTALGASRVHSRSVSIQSPHASMSSVSNKIATSLVTDEMRSLQLSWRNKFCFSSKKWSQKPGSWSCRGKTTLVPDLYSFFASFFFPNFIICSVIKWINNWYSLIVSLLVPRGWFFCLLTSTAADSQARSCCRN